MCELLIHTYIYTYIYVCVCVCVWKERRGEERRGEGRGGERRGGEKEEPEIFPRKLGAKSTVAINSELETNSNRET
jgi:hypothetical protein